MAEGDASRRSGDFPAAAAAFRRAAALDASNGGAWLGLGEVLMTLGDPAGARVAYERYLAIDPAGRHAGEVRSVLERLRP
jgi:Flp pilus assembly protein TadD